MTPMSILLLKGVQALGKLFSRSVRFLLMIPKCLPLLQSTTSLIKCKNGMCAASCVSVLEEGTTHNIINSPRSTRVD